jgi:type II secretory pathway component GspD/PulD (secretin)
MRNVITLMGFSVSRAVCRFLLVPVVLLLLTSELSYSRDCKSIRHRAENLFDQHSYAEALAYINYSLFSQPDCVYDDELKLLGARSYLALGDTASADSTLIRLVAAQSKKTEAALKLLNSYHPTPIKIPADTTLQQEEPAVLQQFEDEEELTAGELLQKPISNSFFETDIRQVLNDISQELQISIVYDKTVEGMVTYDAIEVPLKQVLDAILFPQGLVYTIRDGTIYVGSSSPEEGSFSSLSVTKMVPLANQLSPFAIELLSDYFKPFVKADKINNTVLITAPPSLADRIENDLKELDRPQPQILIEVMVVEVVKDRLREVGIDWSLTGNKSGTSFSAGVNSVDLDNPESEGTYAREGLKIGNFFGDFNVKVQALVQTGDATIRANPKISTINGHTANINITKEQYFLITTDVPEGQEGGYYGYGFFNRLEAITSGIQLMITPFVGENDEITVAVQPEVGDVVGEGANGLPEISKRSVNTMVRVKDSETITIGGLTMKSEKKIENRVPLLGSIPILSYLFKYSRKEVREYELVIFITPHILRM